MEVIFQRNQETGLPHILDHDVTEAEVFELFSRSPMLLHVRRGTMFALGQTAEGRYLKVIFRRDPGEVFVITAYDLQGKALAAYRRRRRRYQRD